jgi:carboxylate-amine ligase
LDVYRHNQTKIPSITGVVIPERVFSAAEYHCEILDPMYRAIAPYDPKGILQEEWLNSRGAIARFDRNAIEIRVTDAQECPAADCAIAMFLVDCIRELCLESWCSSADQKMFREETLYRLMIEVLSRGAAASVDDAAYASCFGCKYQTGITVADILQSIYSGMRARSLFGDLWREQIALILEKGTLAERIVRNLRGDLSPASIKSVYNRLLNCMENGKQFNGGMT